MVEERAKRKLAAILSADVKGYSRLMSQDEEATVKTLKQHRETISGIVSEHRGRVADSPGDNILAEFGSVVDSVKCAVKIQEKLKEKNAELPENRRMDFRIGVNLGDVIEEDDRIYGDGVNIAARLEGLAEAGGICVSGTAFDQIKNKLSVGYQYLGKQTVKNIPDPVRAYKVLMEPGSAGKVIGEEEAKPTRFGWKAFAAVAVLVLVAGGLVWNFYWRAPKIEPASQEKMALPLPDEPSIAVLPFVNMSDDPKQEFFGDGITENIITALSKVPKVLVIARNSSFTYKGKPVKVKQVSEELGVQYVLEGSVQKSADRIRITAQLIDALKGHHLWAERYDRDLKDLFALQDEITIKIISALQVKLAAGETAQILGKSTKNLQAYLKVMEARESFYTITREGFAQAQRLCEQAIALDPEYAAAYIYIGSTHFMNVVMGSSKEPEESLKLAFEFIRKALALDDSEPAGHSLLGFLYVMTKQYDKGIVECERAMTLAPNSSTSNIWMAFVLTLAGKHEEAVQYAEQAIRLDPMAEGWYFRALGQVYGWVGRYDEAISAYKKALQRSPNDILTHIPLALAYSWAGRLNEARAQAVEILRIDPNFSLEQQAKRSLYRNPADRERVIDGLRKAGLPEKPPLPLPEKPSIAVLPFVNMSDDPQQEYFSDGMTEDLITDLSKISGLFVIARNSSFVYKGKAVNVQQVSRELGVKYVLEGSVRRAGDQLRINAQLVDATTGQHLWAERYDGIMKDIFSLQDSINQKIVAALAVKLTPGEKTLLSQKGTHDPAAYEEFLRGREHYLRSTKEDYAKAEICFKRAIELDPNYIQAKAALAMFYYGVASEGPKMWSALKLNYEQARLRARQYLQEAMKEPTSIAYMLAGSMDVNLRQWDAGISQYEKALALDPNDAMCNRGLGNVLIASGRPKEGMEYVKKALQLDPNNPSPYLARIGYAHFCMGEWQEAATACEKAMKLNPDIALSAIILTSAYAHLGRNEEAKAALQAYHRRMGVETQLYFWPFKDRRVEDSFVEGLIKAGASSGRLASIHVSKENQVTGEHLRAFYFPSTTTGYFSQGAEWTLEIAKDGAAILRSSVVSGGVDLGNGWLDGDKLWLQFQKYNHGIAYCSSTFRNATGTPEGKNEYISFNDVWFTKFSRVQ